MKMTVQEIISKLNDIAKAIDAIESTIGNDSFRGQNPLADASDLLEEDADFIKRTKVDI